MSRGHVVSSAVESDDSGSSGSSMATVFGPVQRVYLDFDDTITEGLSTNVQVKAVIESIAKGMKSQEEAGAFVQERKALIAKLAAEYEEDVKQHLMALLAQFPPGVFDLENINRALDMCADLDRKWSQIGIDNKVFAGVSKEDFLRVAPATPVKAYALETIRALQDSGVEVAVTSINWSAEWIQKVIGPNSTVASENGTIPPEGHVKVYSNEMLYENGLSTGELSILMESGRDKSNVLRKLLQEGCSSDGQDGNKSVFIGDSYNDIQALLMVDVGVVMGQNKAFLLFAKHFGIQLKPLSEASNASEPTTPGNASGDASTNYAVFAGQAVLYTTDSWLEVAEALLGKEKAAQYLNAVPAEV